MDAKRRDYFADSNTQLQDSSIEFSIFSKTREPGLAEPSYISTTEDSANDDAKQANNSADALAV